MVRFLVLFVVVAALSACEMVRLDPPGQRTAPPAPTWTVDLKAIHLGAVTFASRAGEWPPALYFQHRPGHPAGACVVEYREVMRMPIVAMPDPWKALFDFSQSIITCGLLLPEHADLRRRFEERGNTRAFHTWINEYMMSCGSSMYRLGWRFDPKTNTSPTPLACVPDWRAVLERYIR